MPPVSVPLVMTSSPGGPHILSLEIPHSIIDNNNFITYDFSDEADSVIVGLEISEPDSAQGCYTSVLSSAQCEMLENYLELYTTLRDKDTDTLLRPSNEAPENSLLDFQHAMLLFTKGTETAPNLHYFLPRLQDSIGDTSWGCSGVDQASTQEHCNVELPDSSLRDFTHKNCQYFASFYLFNHTPELSYTIGSDTAETWFLSASPEQVIQAPLTTVVYTDKTVITSAKGQAMELYISLTDLDNAIYASIDSVYSEIIVDLPVKTDYFMATYIQPVYAPIDTTGSSSCAQNLPFLPQTITTLRTNMHVEQGLLHTGMFLAPGLSTYAFLTVLSDEDKEALKEATQHSELTKSKPYQNVSSTSESIHKQHCRVARTALSKYRALLQTERGELCVIEMDRLIVQYKEGIIDINVLLFGLMCISFSSSTLLSSLIECITLLADPPLGLFKLLRLPEKFPILHYLTAVLDCIHGIEYVYSIIMEDTDKLQQVIHPDTVLKNTTTSHTLCTSKWYKIYYERFFVPLYQEFIKTHPLNISSYGCFIKDSNSVKQRKAYQSEVISTLESRVPRDAIYVDGMSPLKLVKDGNGLKLVEFIVRDETNVSIPIRAPYDTYKNLVFMNSCNSSNEAIRAEIHRIIESQFKLSKQFTGLKSSGSGKNTSYSRKQKLQRTSVTDDDYHSDDSLNESDISLDQTSSQEPSKVTAGRHDSDASIFTPILCEPRETCILLTGTTESSTTMIAPICRACLEVKKVAPAILGVAQIMIDEYSRPQSEISVSTHVSLSQSTENRGIADLTFRMEQSLEHSDDTYSQITRSTEDRIDFSLDDKRKLYLRRDIAIVKASCNPAITVLDLDTYRDICLQLSVAVDRLHLFVHFPDFTFHDYVSLGLYNNKIYYLQTTTALHLALFRFLFDSQYTKFIDGYEPSAPDSELFPRSEEEGSACTESDLVMIWQLNCFEDFVPIFNDLFDKFVTNNPRLTALGDNRFHDAEQLPSNDYSETDLSSISSTRCVVSQDNSMVMPADFIDPESFVVVTVNDTDEPTHISNTTGSVAQLFGPFIHHGRYTSPSRMLRATLILRFITTFSGASRSLQELIRLYSISGSYCTLTSTDLPKFHILKTPKETFQQSKQQSTEYTETIALINQFNNDMTKGQYKATIKNSFSPCSPLLVNTEYSLSIVQDVQLHTNLRSLHYIKWLGGSNSFRPHTFEESDFAGKESALTYIKSTANIKDLESQTLLLNGSVRKKIEAWPHYGVSYRVCPNYQNDAQTTANSSDNIIIWSKDDIPTDYNSSKTLADSVFNRGKYVTIPYGSESYGSVSLLEVMNTNEEANPTDKRVGNTSDIHRDIRPVGLDSEPRIENLADILFLIKQIQINPSYVSDTNTLTSLYMSADRPVTTSYHFMASTGQEASTHHIEEEQVCFGMLKVYINAVLKILIEWLAIYAPSLLLYYDVSLSSSSASAPPDNTRSCDFGFNIYATAAGTDQSELSETGNDTGRDSFTEPDSLRRPASESFAYDPTMTIGMDLPQAGAEADTFTELLFFRQELAQKTVSLEKYFASANIATNMEVVEQSISRKSLYSNQFLADHVAVLTSYKRMEESAAEDQILSAANITNETDRSLRFLAYPYVLFPIKNISLYKDIYGKSFSHSNNWAHFSPPPPRIPTTLQFFLCQVYTGPDVLFSLFTEPLITVPLLARTMQSLLSKTMHAEQRASYVWRTIFPDSHFTNCDQNFACMSAWDKKVLTPKTLLQDLKRRNLDISHGLNPEIWPLTLDPSCIYLGRLVYTDCYEFVSKQTPRSLAITGQGSSSIDTLFFSATRSVNTEPQSALPINFIPKVNPFRVTRKLLAKSQLILPNIITPDYANAEFVRLYRTTFFSMDEEFIKLVICRSQMLFSCINTGFNVKTNQSIYDLCGSNPVSEDIYYFATLGYKHLQNTISTKKYSYPPPVSLLDIEKVISGIKLTYNAYLNNQKLSEYHYTEAEKKHLLDVISFYECEHDGIVQITEFLLNLNIFFHSSDLLAKTPLKELSSSRRHFFMPCVTARSYKFLLNLLLLDTDEDLHEPGFRNTNSATLIGSLGALTADGCKNVLLFEIIPAILLNHETRDWTHSSIDPGRPVYKVICSDLYIIIRLISVICTRIEFCFKILERIPESCRQVGKHGTRTMMPFPLSGHNGRCAAATLFGYDSVDYLTPCGHRIFYSSNQYFQFSETYSLAKCRCNMMRCPYCGGLGTNMGPVSGSYLPVGAVQYVELQSTSSSGVFSSKRCVSGPYAEDKEVCADTYGFRDSLHDNYKESECLLSTSDSKAYHCYPVAQTLLYKFQPAMPLPINLLEIYKASAQHSSSQDRIGPMAEMITKGGLGMKPVRAYTGSHSSRKRSKQDNLRDIPGEGANETNETEFTAIQLLERAKFLSQQSAISEGEGYSASNYGERLVDIVRHLPPLDAYTFRIFTSSEKYLNNRFVLEYISSSLGHESIRVSSGEEAYCPNTTFLSVHNPYYHEDPTSTSTLYEKCQKLRYAPLSEYTELGDPVLMHLLDPNLFTRFYLHEQEPDLQHLSSSEMMRQLSENSFQRYKRLNLLPLEQHIFPSHVQKSPDVLPTHESFKSELNLLLRIMQTHTHQSKDGVLSSEFTSYMYSLLGLYAFPLLSLKKPITTLLRRLESFCSRMATTSMNINYLSLYRPQKANIQSPRSAILFLFLVFATRLPLPYGNLLPLSLPSNESSSDELMLIVENTGGLARFSCVTNSVEAL